MKKTIVLAAAAVLTIANMATAEGDATKGEKDFKKCRACHAIVNGDDIIYKGGKTGPNLYGVIGRQAGSVDGFRYGASLLAAGEGGLIWTEELIATYIVDPRAFLKDVTGDSSAKSKMTFKMANSDDVSAYLTSVSPIVNNEATENDN